MHMSGLQVWTGWLVALLVLHLSLTKYSLAQQAQELPEMTVEGEAVAGPSVYSIELDRTSVDKPDTAALLKKAPGANVNRNGPLTGIAQYRGMYADRVNVKVNGMHMTGAGPNGMDPPLSYVPRNQLGSLEVIRGIAPVSSGAETIGGTIIANTRTSDFADRDGVTPSVEVSGGGATVNNSGNVGGLATLATRNHKLDLYGSREDGGNTEFSHGKIKPTRFERNNLGGGYGFRTGVHEVSVDVRRNETDPTGTPALPMDIVNINTSVVQGGYNGKYGDYEVGARAFWTNGNHKMSNYELREPPTPTATRLNNASADGLGYGADVAFPLATGVMLVGVDGHLDGHDSVVVDPVNNPNFRVVNFNNVDRDVYGLFTEWTGPIAGGMELELGARYNRVNSDAGDVSHFLAPLNPAVNRLQTQFNSADRKKDDNNIDLVAKLSHQINSQLTVLGEVGHKTRAPSYQERYLWIPIEATNGLADGHNYVGDIDLDSEKAYEAGLGIDWHTSRFFVEPRVFYRKVNDYIQGVPATDPTVILVSTANGDPNPLQFANVDAKLYGADAAWGVNLSSNWSLEGIVSYVRGERDDINDNLYRIAPLNGSAALTYQRGRWWTSLEGIAYAKQNKVSETNSEQKTGGYQLLNLHGGIDMGQGISLMAGIENIFDSTAKDHLAGINRVAGSDVGVGEYLPSAGRNFFASLQYRFD